MKDVIQEGIIDDIDDALQLLDDEHLWKVFSLLTATIGNKNGNLVKSINEKYEHLEGYLGDK